MSTASIGHSHAAHDGDLAQLATRVRESTVRVRSGRGGAGTGIIWTAGGIIMTNAHVAQAESAIVEFPGGRTLHATVLAKDQRNDLAALSVNATGLHAAEIRDSSALRAGEIVLAVGNPMGQAGAVTLGIVHSAAHKRWVRADVRLAPGNSGGPLADVNGRVVGINSMIAGGLALAVPSNTAVRFLQRREFRPFLGVASQPALVMREGRRALGLVILDVISHSAAMEADIAIGDVILAINGAPLRRPGDLGNALEDADYGAVLRLDIVRGDRGLLRYVTVRGAPKRASVAA